MVKIKRIGMSCLSVAVVTLLAFPAKSGIPTLDFGVLTNAVSTVKNGVENIKGIKGVTEKAGSLNSIVGDAAGSISKFKDQYGEDIEKSVAMAKQAQARAEEAQASMAKYQGELQERKDQYQSLLDKASEEESPYSNQDTFEQVEEIPEYETPSSYPNSNYTQNQDLAPSREINSDMKVYDDSAAAEDEFYIEWSTEYQGPDKGKQETLSFEEEEAAREAAGITDGDLTVGRRPFRPAQVATGTMAATNEVSAGVARMPTAAASNAPVLTNHAVSGNVSQNASASASVSQNAVVQPNSSRGGGSIASRASGSAAPVVSSGGSAAKNAVVQTKGVKRASASSRTANVTGAAQVGGRVAHTPSSTRGGGSAPLISTGGNNAAPRRAAFGRANAERLTEASGAEMVDSEAGANGEVATRTISPALQRGRILTEESLLDEFENAGDEENSEDVLEEVAQEEVLEQPVQAQAVEPRRFRRPARSTENKDAQYLQEMEELERELDLEKVSSNSYRKSEKLAFAAQMEEKSSGGNPYHEGVFVAPLALMCNVDSDELTESEEVRNSCYEKSLTELASPNQFDAREAVRSCDHMVYQAVLALLAEASLSKQEAASYQQVLDQQDEVAGTCADIRCDLAVVGDSSSQIQYLLNKMTGLLSSQVLLDTVQQFCGIQPDVLGLEAKDGEE